MNTLLKIPVLVAFGVFAAAPLSAGIEPFKVEPTVDPQYSPSMQMDGVTEGTVIFVIEVNAEGKLSDYLVIGYTHPGLVRPCTDALTRWKFTPAKMDGVPITVQAELTVNFKAEGVVISQPALMTIENRLRQLLGQRMIARPCSPAELDSVPAKVTMVPPHYAVEAEKEGVRGIVTVHFYIDETGAVRLPSVEGNAHPYLSNMAVDALRGWRFEPPTSRGKPVMVAARQDFKFSPQ